jgi:thiol-disulfide isomerase/thioredoxin/archaellum component FlaF (FlaF/FlaG flagellin family)
MNRKILCGILTIFLFCFQFLVYAQSIAIHLDNYNAGKVIIYSLSGEKTTIVDSITANTNGNLKFSLSKNNVHNGLYRISFDKNKMIDFVNDGENVSITTNANSILDSLRVIDSESNKLFYSFLILNKAYKTKTELLQLIIVRYPKDDNYYKATQNKLTHLQNEYLEFVNITAQKNPQSFIARYIRSSQLPVIDISIQPQQQLEYLKAHALDNVDFNNSSLIYSDVFTNKTIEYLTYYRNPQLPKELLEKEFMKAVDTLLNKAKVHQLVYQHIIEYLIDGFKKFGFDKALDYIVDNYVIKDDLCLDVKTEGLIKRRIEQAKNFRIGSLVPNIVLGDSAGNKVELNKIIAGKTLIVFYASWCPHCKELLPKLNELKKNHNGKTMVVLAVSIDTKKEDWTSFVKVNCPDLLNVSDLKGWDGKAANDYFIYATPTMFLVDKEKKIIGKPMTIDELQSNLN